MKTKNVYVFGVLLIVSSHALWANEEELSSVKKENTTTVPQVKKLSIDNEPDRIGALSALINAVPTNYNDAEARLRFLQLYHALENPFPGSKKLLELELQKTQDEANRKDLESKLAMLDLLANIDKTSFTRKSSDQGWLSRKTGIAAAVGGLVGATFCGTVVYMIKKITAVSAPSGS